MKKLLMASLATHNHQNLSSVYINIIAKRSVDFEVGAKARVNMVN